MWRNPNPIASVSAAPPRSAGKGEGAIKSKKRATFVVSDYKSHSQHIKDHSNYDVKLVWCPKSDEDIILPPAFPYQVYVTQGAKETVEDIASFAERFASYIEWIGGIPDNCQRSCNQLRCLHPAGFHQDEHGSTLLPDGAPACRHYRFDVYVKPFRNLLACAEHQRREIRYRNNDATCRARLVPSWLGEAENSKRGRILVIDTDDWEDIGPALVEFDLERHPERDRQWWTGLEGGRVVEATRSGAPIVLRERLREWWIRAGSTLMEALLQRRNVGAVSPVLYPAIDPAARFDAEHEEFAQESGPERASTQDEATQDSFDQNELFQKASQLQQLYSKSYADKFGLPITSVWDPHVSHGRPSFTVTLYLAFDTPPFVAKALFACLNKDLIAQSAWTLDVVRDMPGIDTALDYHTSASARRTSGRTESANSRVQMVLRKAVGNRLPPELHKYIEALMVPPEIPEYSNSPGRPFTNFFLYLDQSRLSSGPLTVYSNPLTIEKLKGLPSGAEPVSDGSSNLQVLQVINMRHWHAVADEIHILWSGSSPRSEPPSEMPRVTLTLQLPPKIPWGQFHHHLFRSKHWELHGSRPIALGGFYPLSHSSTDILEIVDLETGKPLPPLRDHACYVNSAFDSWSSTLGLPSGTPQDSLRSNGKQILTPGPIADLHGFSYHGWERDMYRQGLLVDGRKYAVKLSGDISVRRWTFANAHGALGPYNLPGIPIELGEGSQLTFRYAGPTELDVALGVQI